MTSRARAAAAAALLLASGAGCDERRRPAAAPPSVTPVAAPAVATGPGPATPLPPAPTDDLGDGGPTTVIAAGTTGAWVALCVGGAPRLVVGSGPGAPIDRLIAHGPDDVVFARGGGLFHVDAAARTERRLGPVAAAALDPKTRRLAIAWPGEIAVLDPGVVVAGASFSTYSNPPLWHDDRVVVRLAPDGLWLDHLSADPATPPRHQELALPRIAAAVTVDTVTGARRTGPRPPPPEVIGAAGRWLLYGRYLIDLEAGILAATLPVDALAVDARGRVLAAAPTGTGALRWQAPSGR